jgi:DNA-binding transcriptional LysR family regulator
MRPSVRQTASRPFTTPHFDFVDLRLFINVAEAKSLTLGAERSSLSLAAASMRVKHLEATLGASLLYRSKRGTSPTPAGEAFLAHARRIFEELERMSAELRQFARGVKGHLRLFANTTAISDFLPKVLGTFLAGHPYVNIDLRELPSAEIVRAVQEGAADVGIVSGHVSTEGLQTLPYYVDRLVLVVGEAHPLAGRESIPFAEALEYDFVGRNPGSALHVFMSDIVTSYGRPMKLRIQVGSFEDMGRLIEEGIGIGVLPISAVERQNRRVRAVRIADDWSVQSLKICYREAETLPEFARELVEYLVADAAGANRVA